MNIFATICWVILVYLLAGFSTYLISCWYDYKFKHIAYHEMESSDIIMFVLWPFVLIIVIFNLLTKGISKICNPIREWMYKLMDKVKEKKDANL